MWCLCHIIPATRGSGISLLYVLSPPLLASSYAVSLKTGLLHADLPPRTLHQNAACSLFRHVAQAWQLQMALMDTFSKFVTCRPTCNLVPAQIQWPYVLNLAKAKLLAAFEQAAYGTWRSKLMTLKAGEDFSL